MERKIRERKREREREREIDTALSISTSFSLLCVFSAQTVLTANEAKKG